jgi:hypothetical protein
MPETSALAISATPLAKVLLQLSLRPVHYGRPDFIIKHLLADYKSTLKKVSDCPYHIKR